MRYEDKKTGMAAWPTSIIAMLDTMKAYFPLKPETQASLATLAKPTNLAKGEYFLKSGDTPTSLAFVYSGLLRAFTTDVEGREYNKIFFAEGSFPAAMVALLTGEPSRFAIECLEDCQLLEINHAAYRQLLHESDDLKLFHIRYLEQNWIIEKERREVELVQADATDRYLAFLQRHPGLQERLPQYHIASHLGITPTQLSRIRKQILETA